VLKFQNKIIFTFCILFIGTGLFTYVKAENKNIKDILGFNKNIQIIITDVSFRKEMIAKIDEGSVINVNVEQLKRLFLERAIVISGEEMNYVFDYEYVSIMGLIKNSNTTYEFSYNLAGFGTIFLENNRSILYGDPAKKISPERY
jgi:hypothetical protein